MATVASTIPALGETQISIHATLAGGDQLMCFLQSHLSAISIHATLAGGDLHRTDLLSAKLTISIHATLAGGDLRSS